MKTRMVTGLIIMAVYLATIALSVYVHEVFFDAFVLAVLILGAYEMSRVIRIKYKEPVDLLIWLEIVIGYAAFMFFQYYFNKRSLGLTAYIVTFVLFVAITFIVCKASKELTTSSALSTVAVMAYPVTLVMYMMACNYFPEPYRCTAIMMIFGIPAFSDVCAYFVGSTVKGKKLAPSISPNKTISGAIGGLFGGMAAAGVILLFAYLSVHFGINVLGAGMLTDSWTTTIIHFLVIGLLGSVFSQGGDLFASYIKRNIGIKDFSNLLPGHGGILDRVDGMMFAGVFIYLYMSVLVLL